MIKIDRDWYTVADVLEATASELMPVSETGGHRLRAHDGTPVQYQTAEEAVHANIKAMHWLTLGQLVRSGEVTLRAPLSRSPVEWEQYWGMRDIETYLLSSADFAVLCNRLAIAPSDIDDVGDRKSGVADGPYQIEGATVDTADLLTTGEVVLIFDGIYYDSGRWREHLSDPPKWLKECRRRKGTPGHGHTQATWSALELAKAISSRNAKEPAKRKKDIAALNSRFRTRPELAAVRDDWLIFYADMHEE